MTCSGCSRRDVLAGLGLAVLAACHASDDSESLDAPVAPMCGTGEICLDLTLASYAALTSVNGFVKVSVPGDTIIVIRTGDTTVVALSDICTHARCTLGFNSSLQQLTCPCHGSRFTLSGSVARGPASRPVKLYPSTLDTTKMEVRVTVA